MRNWLWVGLCVVLASCAQDTSRSKLAKTALSWPVLSQGAQSRTVGALQYMVRSRGHILTANAFFTAQTKQAVQDFQRANGLTADGVVRAATWTKLITLIGPVQKDSKGDSVRAVQLLLKLEPRQVNGVFDDSVQKALIAFQKARGLTADGVTNEQTWNALILGTKGTAPAVPTVPTGEAAELANQILKNTNIVLYGSPAKVSARDNISDTANGKKALLSGLGSSPGGSVDLSPRMLAALLAISQKHKVFVVTFAGGKSHSKKSYHYVGRAFDIDEVDGQRVSFGSNWRQLRNLCKDLGAVEAFGPGDIPSHEDHVHCAW
jgi:zinc D-Ala-D-Ala carboxypeptidase